MNNVEYLNSKIKPIMKNIMNSLLSERPENPSIFILNSLQNKSGYSSKNLTLDERKELEYLRKEINIYREKEGVYSKLETNYLIEVKLEDKNSTELEIKKKIIKGKGPRIGISAEAYGQFNIKENFTPRLIKKSENQIQRIKSTISNSVIFSNLEPKDLKIVIGAMEERLFVVGEVVIKQGDQGDCLYVVESGDLLCYKKNSPQDIEVLIKKYTAGECFGELALLYNAPRAAKVVAKSECVLWSLDRETFNNIVKDAAKQKREKYETFLRSVEILSTIDTYELMQICDALTTCTYREGDYVIREGEIGNSFFIVEDGEAVATKAKEPGKPPLTVFNYKKGGYFGELALIKGEPRAASIVARSELKLITLDRNTFKRLLGPLEEILKRKSEKLYNKK